MLVWPHWLDDVLAKSPEKSIGESAETLSQHTWNVLQRYSDLVRLRPDLPKQIGQPRLWHCLFWASFMHDFGKAAEGFQRVIKAKSKWPHRHEVLSLAFVNWLFPDAQSSDWLWVIAAIVSHHKDADYMDTYASHLSAEDDIIPALLAEIPESAASGVWQWLDECPQSWADALGLADAGIEYPSIVHRAKAVSEFHRRGAERIHEALDAYRAVERAMRKDTRHPIRLAMMLLRGHLIMSDHMASAHVGQLPQQHLADSDSLSAKLGLDNFYEHQTKCRDARGSVVLMAPTGSGKTEAALLWAVSQSPSRLYYTLPFQASMNAMERRLTEDEKDLDGNLIRHAPFKEQVGLEHSRSTLAYYRRLLLEDESQDPKRATKAAKWLNNLAHLNYYPVRVLSPYQLLKAPYRLKGYETLLSDCYGAAFVFDEIHAYQADRLAKILALVKYLREKYHASFMVMSATLPALLRERLGDALGSYSLITASPELYQRFCRHRLVLKNGDLLSEESLNEIADTASAGQAVLVCCNTVARAQLAWKALDTMLQAQQIRVELLHGRFNGKDRLEKERIVREATGSLSTTRKPIVLVATQVVEVSLDIDLDVIYTDPAPLEALLQRFGRVNRRRRKGHAPVCVFREPVPDKPRPYEPNLVRAALDIVELHQGELIDEAKVSTWLDDIYRRPEIAEPWIETYQTEYQEFTGTAIATLRAFQSDDGLEDLFYRAFDSVDVLPEELYALYLEQRDESPLEASQLLVPLHYTVFGRLKGEGRGYTDEEGKLRLVQVHYDSEIGLDLGRDSRASAPSAQADG